MRNNRRMGREKKRSPLKAVLAIVVLAVIGVIVYNSGILVDLGVLKSDIPDDIGIVPNDPRVIEKVDETLDRNLIKDSVNRVLNLVTGTPEQGVLTLYLQDPAKDWGIDGAQFEIQNAVTGEVLETLTTDENGSATSALLDYKKAYKVVQVKAASPYEVSDETVVFLMKAELTEIHFENSVPEYVAAYHLNDNNTVTVDEINMPMTVLLQEPELPNGCEVTALTALLHYYGYPISKTDLSMNFLPKAPFSYKDGKLYGPDPNVAFGGDPSDARGWFVYAAPTALAGNHYLASVNGQHEVVDLTGSTREDIMKYVSSGHPVAVWVTRELTAGNFTYGWYLEADDSYFEAPTNLHCMVIHGYSEAGLYVMDPLKGDMIYDPNDFFSSFESLGNRAIVIKAVDDAE